MSQVGLVGNPRLQQNGPRPCITMLHLHQEQSDLHSPPVEIMFKCWVEHVKNVSHKWRVEKKVH
jgi:hypothetical protein